MPGKAVEGRYGLPVPNPTVSYWQAKSQQSPIHNHGRDDALPEPSRVVDVCIIGSGISGAMAAYTIQQQSPHLDVIMLEAREACSGATGRNGGHCRPDSFLGFEGYSKIVGQEQAHKVLLNEWDNFNLIRETIEKEQIDCGWWQGLTLSVFLQEEAMRKSKENFESYARYTTLRPDVRFIEDANEAREVSEVLLASRIISMHLH
jgi:glycine/D-amino acid oxidase-like deaminating enzyme